MLEYNVMMLCLLSNQIIIIITLTELLPFNVLFFFIFGLIARQASLNTLLFCCCERTLNFLTGQTVVGLIHTFIEGSTTKQDTCYSYTGLHKLVSRALGDDAGRFHSYPNASIDINTLTNIQMN